MAEPENLDEKIKLKFTHGFKAAAKAAVGAAVGGTAGVATGTASNLLHHKEDAKHKPIIQVIKRAKRLAKHVTIGAVGGAAAGAGHEAAKVVKKGVRKVKLAKAMRKTANKKVINLRPGKDYTVKDSIEAILSGVTLEEVLNNLTEWRAATAAGAAIGGTIAYRTGAKDKTRGERVKRVLKGTAMGAVAGHAAGRANDFRKVRKASNELAKKSKATMAAYDASEASIKAKERAENAKRAIEFHMRNKKKPPSA